MENYMDFNLIEILLKSYDINYSIISKEKSKSMRIRSDNRENLKNFLDKIGVHYSQDTRTFKTKGQILEEKKIKISQSLKELIEDIIYIEIICSNISQQICNTYSEKKIKNVTSKDSNMKMKKHRSNHDFVKELYQEIKDQNNITNRQLAKVFSL